MMQVAMYNQYDHAVMMATFANSVCMMNLKQLHSNMQQLNQVLMLQDRTNLPSSTVYAHINKYYMATWNSM